MSEWKETTLGELVTFQRGHDLPKTEFNDGEYPILGSNGIIGYHNEYTTEGAGITIGRSGNIGNPFYTESNFWAHNTTLYVKEFHNSFPKFVFYFLKTIDFQSFNSGSAVPSLNRNYIHPFPVFVPEDIEEQKQIADVLSCLDAKIENLRRQNETLEQIAQTLFKHWFIDFEFPNADGKPYKSSGGAMLASELGDIPEAWKVGKLGAIGKIITGKTPSTQSPNLWGDGLPFITPTDFKNYGKYILSAERKISQLAISQFKQYIVPQNSIVVTCIGSDMGKAAKTSISCITNQQINPIVLLQDFYFHEYIFNYLKSQYKLLRNIALGGSTMPIINKSAFSNIEILMPSLELLNYFENIISALNQKIINNENQIQTLTKTRDSLLPKLMSGQLRVKE